MHASSDVTSRKMFDGLARSHLIRDLAAVALCLSFTAGFVAHASTPAPTSPASRSGSSFVATTAAAPQPCPDVRLQ